MNDEYVHFGDVVQIANLASGAVLAVDVEARDPRPAENACAVSAAVRHADPCARNTFTFEKYVPRSSAVLIPTYDDDVLHYGQKVKLVVNPRRAARRPCVSSPSPSRRRTSPGSSRNCEVVACGNDSYECVFEVLTPDPAKRLVSEGVAVMAGAPVVFLHCQTNQCLSVEGLSFTNDFGDELEVCGRTNVGAGNSYVMEGIATGKPQSMTQKAPGNVNVFTIVGGMREARAARRITSRCIWYAESITSPRLASRRLVLLPRIRARALVRPRARPPPRAP